MPAMTTRERGSFRPDELRELVSGEVIGQQAAGYDEARRVWNGMIDRRPLAVVRAASIADIEPVISYVRENGLPLAVRGGGHNVAGNGTVDDGIVLDLGGLKGVAVDEQSATVTVEPGVTLGDLDRATQPAGLIVPSGVVSGTGLVGLTLGGGFGWLTRAYGLTIDSMLAAEVITAAGDHVHASEPENSELFWGLRGGGGNFGVVTAITYRAQRLGPQVFAGNLIYNRQSWRAALESYSRWTADLPDELTSIVTFIVPDPAWELGSDPIMLVGFTWASDDQAEAERIVDRMRGLAKPDVDAVEPARWVDWQSQADGLFPRGSRAYWKNVALDALGEAEIDAVLAHVDRLAPGSAADVHHMGGAVSRVPEGATAFPDRTARYWINIYGFWADPAQDADRIAWTRSFHAALQPAARAGEYVNFLGTEGPRADARQLALTSYGPAKLDRLVQLKRRYDPTNLFRLNHNIPPD
jgi:FAD/FMN-containing dehydrogenase